MIRTTRIAVLARLPTPRPCSRWIARWRSSNCCCAPARRSQCARSLSGPASTAPRPIACWRLSIAAAGSSESRTQRRTVPACAISLWCAHRCLDGTSSTRYRPTMERLSLLSRETVHLGVLDNHDVLHIEKVDSPEIVGVSSRVGTRAAPHVTGLGKALLAAGPDEELEVYIEHAAKRSLPRSAFDREAFRAEIALARQAGIQHRRWRVITRGALSGRSCPGRRRQSALRHQSDRTVRSLHRGADGGVCAGDARGGARPVNPVRWRSEPTPGGGGVTSQRRQRKGEGW